MRKPKRKNVSQAIKLIIHDELLRDGMIKKARVAELYGYPPDVMYNTECREYHHCNQAISRLRTKHRMKIVSDKTRWVVVKDEG